MIKESYTHENLLHLNYTSLTPKDKDNVRKMLYIFQHQKCAICGIELLSEYSGLLDHCHKTNIIRGLLCCSCNIGLGFFKDNADIMRKAVHYLYKELTFKHV